MPKRFVVCCDGTWQNADNGKEGVPSNVARFSRIIAPVGKTSSGEPIEQVVFYQNGVGSGTAGFLDKVTQGAVGHGLEENVIEAYHFLATNWSPPKPGKTDDEICLFGFSRGAYTARALGWILTQMGLLEPVDLEHFRDLYALFKTMGDKDPFGKAVPEQQKPQGWTKKEKGKPARALKTGPTKVKVDVVGVWDTVGSLGLPESWLSKLTGYNKGKEFANTALNSSVKHAFQALALDEHRGAFTPTLWYLETDTEACDMRQCWFPGFHCDIGGGDTSDAKENEPSIDDMSLAWMCDQVDRSSLIEFDKDAVNLVFPSVADNAQFRAGRTNDPCNAFYSLGVGGSSIRRTPGSYHKDLNTIPDAELDHSTRERIHPCVKLRIDAYENYYPLALDEYKDWGFNAYPKWQYVVEKGAGNGASWKRPEIKEKKGVFGVKPAVREISIKEHVIREVSGKINFEIKLLPKKEKEMLMEMNKNVPFVGKQ